MAKLDQWTFRPAMASLGIVAVLVLGSEMPGHLSLLFIPIMLLGFAIGIIALLAIAITLAVRKRPRKAAAFLFALIMPVLLWTPIVWVIECVHLGLTVGFGVGQLGPTIEPNGHGLTKYDWTIGLAGQQSTFLVYDETDKIASPADPIHFQNSDDDFAEGCVRPVRHLLGHYYLCTESY